MNIALWIVAAFLAAVFTMSGVLKLAQSKSKLAESGMGWVENFEPGTIKAIGALELLGAVGLIVPAALGIATVLTPLAAVGLILVMAGAIVVHQRRQEYPFVAVNIVLLVLAAFVAWGRFGPYSFGE
ncbi:MULTISPECIES: DoxX family protein [unclassified Nocardia]|uniref:DoxX family protein n=1 Tax=unclassified Nocardia TaxID=2637762 RepID=UPI0033BDAC83